MMRRLFCLLMLICFTQNSFAGNTPHIDKTVTIVGGGLVGLLEAYYTFKEAESTGEKVQVVILEKNGDASETTISNILPSLTPDEIMAVVPRGSDLVKFLKQKFNDGQGVRVDDVEGIDESSESVRCFIESVELYGQDDEGHQKRSRALLDLGKYCMDMWQKFYDEADEDLQAILRSSNYKPCLEVGEDVQELHKGYRIDLLFNDFAAKEKAQGMQKSYNGLGYTSSRILAPREVISIDPQLKDFVLANSTEEMEWAEDAVALWRPGGCINGGLFIPQFIEYLQRNPLFEIVYDQKVVSIDYEGVNIANISTEEGSIYPETTGEKEFIFAPGASVGTLRKLGLSEPDHAIFAGPSLRLCIDIPEEMIERYKSLDHCMEVHQEGIVLAWQAKFREGKAYIGVAGTKAFYGDKEPKVTEEFARMRHILQLNIVNSVYWDLITMALGKDSTVQALNQEDLDQLIDKGIAKVWVGSRACAYDGFPTLGAIYRNSELIPNGRVTTHLGSGGGSFAHGCIMMSRQATPEIATFADSRR